MKKYSIFFLLMVLLCGFLCACGQTTTEPKILVNLVETDDFTVEENGIWIYPGQDVCFTIRMNADTELSGTDYGGNYYIWKENGVTKLELRDVRAPSRVTLDVTYFYRHITYDPNGGEGDSSTITYDTTIHTRPNTSIGTNLFSREGWTLTCWNTSSDGSGTRIGLGSRATVPEEGMTLYAQWEPWSSIADFSYTVKEDGVTILQYLGQDDTVVVPELINDLPVTTIAYGAFAGTQTRSVILPKSLISVEDGAFAGCTMESILLFDNIESVSDAAFVNCTNLQTLYINAIEAPFGYTFRRESMYADKIDLLINAAGQKKVVFYGGCSMWYNLNGQTAQDALKDYTVINAAINGTVNSYIQMQIMEHYLEAGDIFFHTPELPSKQQLMTITDMGNYDDKLWCGLENNYDLFALVDIRGIGGVFDTFCTYLSKKTEATDYQQQYVDSEGNLYMDSTGSLPFLRTTPRETLVETELVCLDLERIQEAGSSPLVDIYRSYTGKGVIIYVSYASLDYSALTAEELANVERADQLFRNVITRMDGPVLISTLWDYLYDESQFYDSAFHLLSSAVDSNTATWLRDLREQMVRDGLLDADP